MRSTPGPELSTRERGFALAAVRALGAGAEAFCARRSAALAEAGRRLAQSEGLVDAERAALSETIPFGIDEIHASWYAPPPPSRHPLAARYLQRIAYGHLVGMTGSQRAASDPALRLVDLERAPLAELLRRIGKRRIAIAFSGAPPAALAQLCARIGEPDATLLIAETRAIPAGVSADEVKAAQRALVRGGGGDAAATLFLRIGCGWLAPALANDGDRLQRLAQRLPRDVGELLVRESTAPSSEADRAAALLAAGTQLASLRGSVLYSPP